MNRALLEGILEETLTVKIQDDRDHNSVAEAAVFEIKTAPMESETGTES